METDFKIYGKITAIGNDRQVSENFKVREFAIMTEGRYPQEIKFQLIQARCDLIDVYRKEDYITVYFDIQGKRNKDNKIFNNLNAWRIEGARDIPEPAPQSRIASSVTPSENNPYQQPSNASGDEDDDLPF